MQNRKKARSATITLVICLLLTGISTISIAENIPIDGEGLEKIGADKVRLESGIGVIVFNLSEGSYSSAGYLTVSNTYNSSVTIFCSVVPKLSSVDLDDNGSARLHPTISNKVLFNPIPDASWISLESEKAVVDPCSIYNFRYTVSIPRGQEFDTSRGYLLYINVRKDLGDVTGAHIGIDYNYKLFIIFTGESKQEQKQEQKQGFISQQMIMILVSLAGFIGIISMFVYFTAKKHTLRKKATASDIIIPKKMMKRAEEPVLDISKRIDELLERDKLDGFGGANL